MIDMELAPPTKEDLIKYAQHVIKLMKLDIKFLEQRVSELDDTKPETFQVLADELNDRAEYLFSDDAEGM